MGLNLCSPELHPCPPQYLVPPGSELHRRLGAEQISFLFSAIISICLEGLSGVASFFLIKQFTHLHLIHPIVEIYCLLLFLSLFFLSFKKLDYSHFSGV